MGATGGGDFDGVHTGSTSAGELVMLLLAG